MPAPRNPSGPSPFSLLPWLESSHDPFHAMGHPVRRYVVDYLAQSEATAGELAEMIQHHFGIGWPAVSKHLRILREAGFVRARSEWSSRIYRLDDEAIDKLECRVLDLRQKWIQRNGAGYFTPFEPEEAPWPAPRTRRRPTDADDAIDRMMRENGYDPETGKRMVGQPAQSLQQ
ncbi:ArsR/SmtB family transcription factor [Frondihabitans cladoniiphilus]|uniref:HTH arsR-type domain-containing protein n=1 Tax=Frondihabitans cladoniiphilus TaxID=715785 RepID=A0ABP8VJF2_9MICO